MDRGTCLHESGHSVIAKVCKWTPGPVTVSAGSMFGGCSFHIAPPVPPGDLAALDTDELFVFWPAGARRQVEAAALVSLAGQVAQEVFTPRTGRVRERITTLAAEVLAELPPLPAWERAELVTAVNDAAGVSDEEKTGRWARVAWNRDVVAGAHWISLMREACATLLLRDEERVRRLADALYDLGSLGTEQVAALL
jgi:hypothetical protein